jgi:tRNA(fMet)-specific endonuclease VapC
MPQPRSLLDTDVLSAVLRGNPNATDLYAMLRRRGQPSGDADLLIAASALTYGVAVVTNNEEHFQRVPGLQVANWLKT